MLAKEAGIHGQIAIRRSSPKSYRRGLSCRAAAERFGVSAASAIRWRDRQKKAGDFTPQKQGGDRRARRIEEHSQLILDAVAAKSDITLVELRGKLMEHSVAAGVASLWRFFKRRKITLKKNGARRRTTTQRYQRGPRGMVRRPT